MPTRPVSLRTARIAAEDVDGWPEEKPEPDDVERETEEMPVLTLEGAEPKNESSPREFPAPNDVSGPCEIAEGRATVGAGHSDACDRMREEFAWLFKHPQFGTTGLEDDAFSPEVLAADAARAADGSLPVAFTADGDINAYSAREIVRRQLAKAEAALAAAEQGTGAIEDVNMFWAILLHQNDLIERYVRAGGP